MATGVPDELPRIASVVSLSRVGGPRPGPPAVVTGLGARVHPAVAPARAVLFDFDFTLADSSEGVVVCMNHALGRLGLPPAPADAICRTIGLDLPTALGILAGEEWRSREEEFFEHFVRKADEVIVASTSFLPGAARVLRALRDAGCPAGVVTTKYRHRVEDALERDGLRGLVDVIVGIDDVPRPKPAPDGLQRAAGLLGIPAGDCVYVGDSEVDAMAAQAAGMAFVAVLSGTTGAEVFARYPARAVLAGIGEVVDRGPSPSANRVSQPGP
ncbi:MAG: HAD-IA family hydrolase [Gemmatimonadetes bacterium]|nr:HAD-IA family hydrolase [Gemmatimonadota bacterium]MYA12825.1 HAD-IA family hydrolase [Gemmatimonadota bacterium]MYD12712.1 HAD-IA family hydrolase [Gemmatimonadota bacterium]MYE69508.1 HAD-IA family hydrolase [Gemmatimonadota bacterium]MYI65266.1 HAD-IA family hydrolase [Gemmatimonadota bacterium]